MTEKEKMRERPKQEGGGEPIEDGESKSGGGKDPADLLKEAEEARKGVEESRQKARQINVQRRADAEQVKQYVRNSGE